MGHQTVVVEGDVNAVGIYSGLQLHAPGESGQGPVAEE